MGLMAELAARHGPDAPPFLVRRGEQLRMADVLDAAGDDLSEVRQGDVVALIGDFEPRTIRTLLRLVDLKTILVPLAIDTRANHAYFLEAAEVDVVVEAGSVRRVRPEQGDHPMLRDLRDAGRPGLVLFSSGTTGRPKAILHDFGLFLERFTLPRPCLRTLNFLLFDHIGGLNTLFHTMFNGGCVVVPSGRTPQRVMDDIADFAVDLLPTTPTFLRMMVMSGILESPIPDSLKVITYGTELMDPATLRDLCGLLPTVDFRQTYGMSELGILRVRSKARDSLWMTVGGDGIALKVVDSVLKIRSANRMRGYLNAASPFDGDGWYDTKDVVEQDGAWLRITGRLSETISVGGVKFLPSEIERVALAHPAVALAQAKGVPNPITGQHVELLCELRDQHTVSRGELRQFLADHLPEALQPHRVRLGPVPVNHRFKRQ